MPDPKIHDTKPAIVELEAGKKYAWCACGRSSAQPYCDGSHAGTAFRPVVFEAEESKRAALCNCKHSGGQPFCDGKHKDL